MKHSIEALLDIVHAHYPRGLDHDDQGYKRSDEVGRLAAARRAAGADPRKWRALLQRLTGQFPGRHVLDGSTHLPSGELHAAWSGKVFLPRSANDGHVIGFLVSFLVPCYVVYSSRFVDDPVAGAPREQWHTRFAGDTCFALPGGPDTPLGEPGKRQRQVITFDFTPEEQPYAEWLAREIEDTWGYERMPPEIGKVAVPDVATNLRPVGEAAIYDCLFSDDW